MSSSGAPLPDPQVLEPFFAELQGQGGNAERIGFVRDQLTLAFQAATARAQRATEMEARLDTERDELSQMHCNLETEKSRLQEEQKKLSDAATALLRLPIEVKELSDGAASAKTLDEVKGTIEALSNDLRLIDIDKQLRTIPSKDTISGLLANQLDKIEEKAQGIANTAAQAAVGSSSDKLTASLPKLSDLQQWSTSVESSRLEAIHNAVSQSMSSALTRFQASAIQELQATITRLKLAVEQEEVARKALEVRVVSLIREKQQATESLQNELREKGERLEGMDSRRRELEQTLESTRTQLVDSRSASCDHERKALSLEKEVAAKAQQLNEMDSRLRELTHRMTDSSTRLTEIRDTSKAHEEKALALSRAVDAKEHQLAEMDRRLSETKSQLLGEKAASERHEATIANLGREAISKDQELVEKSAHLRQLEQELQNRPVPSPETPLEQQEIASELGKMYTKLAHECSGIPTARGSSYTFHMRTLAIEIAPLMLSPNARLHLLSLLSKEMHVWRCLDEVSYKGASADSSQERVCRKHSGRCVLVRVVEIEGREMLDFYRER